MVYLIQVITMKKDTIAAIATALGESAINVVRLSGDDAFEILSLVFEGPDIKALPTHTVHYGHIVDGAVTIDEVLVTLFRAPSSFTREHMVEIGCHGGTFVARKILELLLSKGARLAEPGEFTERAFLNGRIDLTQAESVLDIIEARTDLSLKLANQGLRGVLRDKIRDFRRRLLDVVAHIEVNIDYPEYDDVEELTDELVLPKVVALKDALDTLLSKAEDGKVIRDGVKTAIIGKPNVGKSSLLNTLLGEERAIVTDIQGTTRDTVEASLNMGGVVLHLIDTAGIREAADAVERIGVERAKNALASAELVLFVLDNSAPLTAEDDALLTLTKDKKRIVIINKIDLESKIGREFDDAVYISALTKANIETLESRIKSMFLSGDVKQDDLATLANARQIGLLKQAAQHLADAEQSARNKMPVDIIEIDLKNAWETLGEITGDTHGSDLLDELFSKFCLGK